MTSDELQSAEADDPKKIAGGLAEGGGDALDSAARAGVGPRRDVNRGEAFVLKQFADAEDVIGVTHRDAAVQSVGAHDDGYAAGGLGGIGALSFGNESVFRDAALAQIVFADSAFAETGIGGRAAGSDHHRRQMLLVKIEGVIEAGAQHWRGTAGIFRRSEDHDGVGGM